MLADSTIKTKFDDLGCIWLASSPDEIGRLISEETEKWGRVVKISGARVD